MALLQGFSVATVAFIGRDSNHDAHQFIGLGHVKGARSWLGQNKAR